MAVQLRRGGGNKPPIAVLYGKPGIGKTTMAACAPRPVFVQTEDGLTSPHLEWVPTFGVLQSYEQVLESFDGIAASMDAEGFKTVVIDSVDRLNPLIVDYVCRQNQWKKLEDGAYGRGKVAHVDEWRNFMNYMLSLRNDLGLGVLMLAHHKAVKMTPPDSEGYTQYSLTLPEDVARILIGDSDLVMFATHPITTISDSAGFNKKVTRAVADKPRIYTQERGGWVAKNRYSMPEWLPMEWNAIAQYVPAWAVSQPSTAAPEQSSVAAE